jgi:tRNA-dihydrouridine synthase 1
MLESDRFATDLHYRRTHFITCDEERPLIVQFSANDPQVFAQAAAMVAPFCDGVELNLGVRHRERTSASSYARTAV